MSPRLAKSGADAHIDHRLVDVAAAYSLTEAGDVFGNPGDSVCALSLSIKPLSILTNTTRRLRVFRLPITVPFTPLQLMR
jgi:hypothetical protein